MDTLNRKRSKFHIKRVAEIAVEECIGDQLINNLCQETDLCQPNQTKKFEIIDIEDLREKAHLLRIELERNFGTILWFERECEVLEEEIKRLQNKIIELEL
jgi:hypothetical protein